jgi:epsilon-lactone hydrolase
MLRSVPGEAGATEAIPMAGLEHFKVISVDCRMPPEAYFPAAVDDMLTVYKAAQRTTDPKNIGIFGASAGGALTLEVILRAKERGLALPGAISAGTPMSDVTRTGASFYTNELVDNVLVSRDGFCDAATVVYANGHDLKDPLLSPVYGDMQGFPPAILTTGTRDLLLSNTCGRTMRCVRPAWRRGSRCAKASRMRNTCSTIGRRKLQLGSARLPASSTSISETKPTAAALS